MKIELVCAKTTKEEAKQKRNPFAFSCSNIYFLLWTLDIYHLWRLCFGITFPHRPFTTNGLTAGCAEVSFCFNFGSTIGTICHIQIYKSILSSTDFEFIPIHIRYFKDIVVKIDTAPSPTTFEI